MIRKSTVKGQETTTIDDGDWVYQQAGWGSFWTATHTPTETVINTHETTYDAARYAVRKQETEPAAEAEPTPFRITVESRFNRRFTGHRRAQT